MQYTEEEINLMKGFEELPKKQCKKCDRQFPMNKVFFIPEKRCNDGYEGTCRKCRTGKFLNVGKNANPKNIPVIDKTIVNNYITIYDQYEYFLKENKIPYRTFVIDQHLDLFKYAAEKDNINKADLNKLNRDWFKEKRLYSPLLKLYKGKVYDYVNTAYPNLFKPWEFATVGRKFWYEKENRVTAIKWFIDELLKDEIINSINEIPQKINGNEFREYGLSTLLSDYYRNHISNAINEVYPNKFNMWQYANISEGYYDLKENRIDSLKHLVEKHLKIHIEDIPKVFSYEYFNLSHEENLYKFKRILDVHYDSLYDYVNECYPDRFKEREFPYKNSYPTLDNIKVRSEPERQIHHLLMRNNLNYKYGDYVGRMSINNITVLPDWYIYHDRKIILVEYYGMLDMTNVDYGYNDKHEQKNKLYNYLCEMDSDYEYLAIYKEDLKDNYKGLKDKLIKYNIHIN